MLRGSCPVEIAFAGADVTDACRASGLPVLGFRKVGVVLAACVEYDIPGLGGGSMVVVLLRGKTAVLELSLSGGGSLVN